MRTVGWEGTQRDATFSGGDLRRNDVVSMAAATERSLGRYQSQTHDR